MNKINITNSSQSVNEFICVNIIMEKIPETNIKYFDLVLLIPSFMFFIFLIFRCRNIYKTVISTNSIINTFYILLFFASSIKVIRALVVIILNSKDFSVQIADKALWLIVRFFLLSTEMSIITFGVAASKLDNRQGIRRVLIVTSLISFSYTAIQASLEFAAPDSRFYINSYSIYGHGGALFFFISSSFFFIIYLTILVLPTCKFSRNIRLPTKRIFYIYCGTLMILYFIEAIGSILFYLLIPFGLCFIDGTSFFYFVFYDPLVYLTFLHSYLKNRSGLQFKYNQNVIEYPETSEECYKAYSNGTNSTSHNQFVQGHKSDDFLDATEDHREEENTHFYPDNLLTLDRNSDILNINQIMKNYNILSEGAQLDYARKYTTPSLNYFDMSSSDEKEKSVIFSLSDGADCVRKETWDLSDFANH